MNKKITIYDLAKAAGVSTTTVYKALHGLKGISEKKRGEILELARSMEYSSNIVAQTLARKQLQIGVVLDADNTDFLQKVIDGITFASNQLKDYKVTVHFSTGGEQSPMINKAATLQALEEMLINSMDAIILYPSISYREFQEFNDTINRRNIPIVTINNEPSTLDYLACVQYDGALLGKMAGELMNLCSQQVNSAAFVGNRDVSAQDDMLSQYAEALRLTQNDLVISYDNQYDDKVNELLAKNMVENYPYLNGLFVGVSQFQGIIKYLSEQNLLDQYKIITVDVMPETLDLLAQRKILATLDRHPFLIGQLAVDILYAHLTTGCNINGTIAVPSTVVLPCNAKNYCSVNDLASNWARYFVQK